MFSLKNIFHPTKVQVVVHQILYRQYVGYTCFKIALINPVTLTLHGHTLIFNSLQQEIKQFSRILFKNKNKYIFFSFFSLEMLDNFIQSFKWNLVRHWVRIILLINLQLPLRSDLNV